MTESSPYRIVLSTCPDEDSARRIANTLVEGHLAACVSIIPGLRSVFRWEGKVESADETLLVIKTRQEQYAPLEAVLRDHHPYALPEILSFSVDAGLSAYLAWIDASLADPQ
jgi:periplasmic divalent cation tolerance protein